MRNMGGKEKTLLVIANVTSYQGSDKTLCTDNRKNGKLSSAVPPPIPMSPIVEKMEGLKAIRNRSNSLRLGRLAFYRHLEKVETMRCFWELKHVELEGGSQQVKDAKSKDEKDKAKGNLKGVKVQKKRKAHDGSDSPTLNEPVLQEKVEELNRQNTELSVCETQREDEEKPTELILTAPDTSSAHSEEAQKSEREKEEDVFDDSECEEDKLKTEEVQTEQVHTAKDEGKAAEDIPTQICNATLGSQESNEDVGDVASSSKRRGTEEDLVKDDLKKSRVDDHNKEELSEETEQQASTSEQDKSETEEAKAEHDKEKDFNIDFSPPPSAPFDHRIVTPKPHQIATYYTINREEVLGGGRFGQVHKCIENSSGLTLAAKIIKARSQKEKEVVRNEIQVMNQLNHANLIQLYAAFESRHDIILVMEYVEGGELFDRIIDENYNLTELDTVLFIRQICEGLQYMHKMYILHLDLKPENILCVSRVTNKIKIIDFGLARRYKPREKLRVNFGTPEFLAPEVINYEFVSFPTDMWSLGVITYMLLSGLSPFLGDDDNETLNNILACQWNFEEEEFTDVSDEAKDFITRLLVKSKSWRMSATESLKHPWLSDQELHYKLDQKKNKCHSTHAPPPES
ncbi:myosin light chain kinase family member 4 isoform X2 [Periophthalmus magnuspinnatus]|uniref:myosin light chain kinase family member 4 isoform X2 n=1 Tax=Periophthalmus magnuspinnatus TaxID=409849 RepID=UPI0024365C8C|nr:myosin light chain kinase family member 4 isoform X2 [Periophthalmus magnuspinnatus]